jgi:hypothetical protein
MRGMHRLLAAILLAGAIGGVVVFTRHLGRVPEPLAVALSAPPPQSLTAPGAVHAPLLVTARPDGPFGEKPNAVPARRATTMPPLTRFATKPVKLPRVPPAATAPATAPAPTPAIPPQQEPVRVLAVVPLTPVAPASTTASTPTTPTADQPGHGKGHAYGHAKRPKAAKRVDEPPAPVSQPAPAVVELTPVAGSSAATDTDPGHDHGNGNGNGRGSDSGNGNGNGRGSGNGNGHGG